jgi:hypothetical protein
MIDPPLSDRDAQATVLVSQAASFRKGGETIEYQYEEDVGDLCCGLRTKNPA